MVVKQARYCWEFHKCPDSVRDKCPAYTTDMGKECWLIASAYQKEKCPGRVLNKIKDCYHCPWFKELNPDID